ncbi:MAG: glycoside hydrolase family 92 protein, partial [Myxococcales bacterium]|nr:glycoside hydrolase family 92 protein [Myxococcales bacterium]
MRTRSRVPHAPPWTLTGVLSLLSVSACTYELHDDQSTDGATTGAASVTSDASSGETASETASETSETGETGEDLFPWPDEDLTALVDPMIGSGGVGYGVGTINPGPTVPFSLVKVGPDTGLAGLQLSFVNCAGYSYDNTHVWGFAHNRFNGMGVPDYGALLVTPTTAMDSGKTKRGGARSLFSHDQEEAEPGYYAVTLLDTGVHAELTGGMYGAHHRYTWAQPTDDAVIVFDLGYIPAEDPSPDSHVELAADGRSLRGWTTTQGGYSKRFGGLKTYFHARLDRAADGRGVWGDDGVPQEDVDALSGGSIGAYLRFDLSEGAATVELQVGLSYISEDQAAQNLDASLPAFEFDATREQARAAWQAELARVRVLGGSAAERVKLYSSMYRAHLSPTMYSEHGGRYRGFDGEVHDDGG